MRITLYRLESVFLLLLLFSFFILGLENQLQAQSHPDKKTLKIFRQAEAAYQANDFAEAEFYLAKALKREPGFVKAYLLQGDIFASRKRLDKAVESYRRGLAIDSVSYPAAFFVLAGWEYKTGNYTASLHDIRYFLKFEKKHTARDQKAEKLLQNATFAAYAVVHPQKISLRKLGDSINSPADEYINFVDEEQKQLIFTRKILVKQQEKPVYKEHFYKTLRHDSVWQKPKRMVFSWDSTWNMGAMSLSTDGRTMYFTGCYWPRGFGSCDIYVSRKRGTQWLFPKHLDGNVNTSRWEAQAVVSSDNRRLFFASKRPGGLGGSDIWMCIRQADGRWGKAVNLGDSINTPGNEMAPFLHADGQTLYFSSDGRTGLGGYDLYVSRLNSAGKWTKAVNLGFPVNTKANEMNVFVSLNGRCAWLSSDRDTAKTGFDIYSFPVYPQMQPGKVLYIKGIVQDAHSGKKLLANVILTDLTNNRTVDSVFSDAVTGSFLMVLHAGKDYAFNIQKKGYLIYSQRFNLKEFPDIISLNKIFALTPVTKGAVMRLQNIYFGFNRSVLQPSAYSELDKLVGFMKENPEIKILIAGYTDNTGSWDYNLKLSLERAKVVFDYLVSKGIDAKRMQYKGFGNRHPLLTNETPQGRAANRRTEIMIQ